MRVFVEVLLVLRLCYRFDDGGDVGVDDGVFRRSTTVWGMAAKRTNEETRPLRTKLAVHSISANLGKP
jgi:hypothetical protein